MSSASTHNLLPMSMEEQNKKGTFAKLDFVDEYLQNPAGRAVASVFVSGLWMLLSSGLILLNKYLMVEFQFEYPMALAGNGMFFSAIASYLVCRVFKLVKLQPQLVSWQFYFKSMVPIGLCMAGTLYCGNLVYLHLSVPFIQMLKACTPIITMLCLFIAQLESPSARLILSVLVIAIGTVIASLGEIRFSTVGVIIMFTSEFLESIRLVMTQYLMAGYKFNPIESLMYLAPPCAFWLLFGSACIELRPMIHTGALARIMASPFNFILAGTMGFMVNTCVFFVIKLTSSLTLKTLGTIKNTMVVVYAWLVQGDQVSLTQWVGYSIGLTGFLWYTNIKATEPAKQQHPLSSKLNQKQYGRR